MVQAHPLSLLARQHLVLKGTFAAKHPHAWLRLESVASSVAGSVEDTWVPGQSGPRAPGEALCYELAGAERFRVGSAPDNEVVVPDAGVAAEHVVLRRDAGGWHVTAGGSVPQVVVNGDPLAAGIEVPLESGAVLSLAGARLTFFDARAFAGQVADAAARL